MNIKSTLHIIDPKINFSPARPESVLLVDGDPLTTEHHHTSLGDCSASYFIDIALKCHEVIFYPILLDPESDLGHQTLLVLNYLSHLRPIVGFSPDDYIEFEDRTPDVTQGPCLWAFGCSHTYGIGIEPSQRYAELLSNKLNRNLKMMAHPGSSLFHSLCRLTNSSFAQNDIVVWQITTPGRLTRYHSDKLHHTRISDHPALLDYFDDDQIFFEHISFLKQGVSYLRKCGIKFVMTSILNGKKDWYRYLSEYVKYPEYCYTPNFWIDLGTDNLHAGPLSNQLLASRLANHLQYINGKSI